MTVYDGGTALANNSTSPAFFTGHSVPGARLNLGIQIGQQKSFPEGRSHLTIGRAPEGSMAPF